MKIRLKSSLIGRKPNQVATMKALGLSKIGDEREISLENPAIKGMFDKVKFMLEVTE